MLNLTKILRQSSIGVSTVLFLAAPALAGDINIEDAYARSSGKSAKSGAIFMQITNSGDADDRLVAARTNIAKKTELHTHVETDQGVMQMRKVEDGFEIPAGGQHVLARGGDHVMMMGLTGPMQQGDTVELTLTFEKSGELVVEVPVDLERKPGMKMSGEHKHDM